MIKSESKQMTVGELRQAIAGLSNELVLIVVPSKLGGSFPPPSDDAALVAAVEYWPKCSIADAHCVIKLGDSIGW